MCEQLDQCARLADVIERAASEMSDSMRQDEAQLVRYKEQVEADLKDARQAESDFNHRFDLQAYGRHGAIPSPFFASRLALMTKEVAALRPRIAELDGAVSSTQPPMSPEDLEGLANHHKALFDHAASRMQVLHDRVEAYRR